MKSPIGVPPPPLRTALGSTEHSFKLSKISYSFEIKGQQWHILSRFVFENHDTWYYADGKQKATLKKLFKFATLVLQVFLDFSPHEKAAMWRPSRLSQADKNQEIPGNIFACEAVNVEIAVVRRKRAISTGGDNTNEVWFPEKKNSGKFEILPGFGKKKHRGRTAKFDIFARLSSNKSGGSSTFFFLLIRVPSVFHN